MLTSIELLFSWWMCQCAQMGWMARALSHLSFLVRIFILIWFICEWYKLTPKPKLNKWNWYDLMFEYICFYFFELLILIEIWKFFLCSKKSLSWNSLITKFNLNSFFLSTFRNEQFAILICSTFWLPDSFYLMASICPFHENISNYHIFVKCLRQHVYHIRWLFKVLSWMNSEQRHHRIQGIIEDELKMSIFPKHLKSKGKIDVKLKF